MSSIISKLNKDNVIHISPSEDGKISFCIFEKKPKSIKINRIDILKFPELNPNRENWDVKYPGQSSDITRPDLIWDISQSTKLSTLLSRDNNIDRDDNAEQGKVYPQIFENPVTIQKGISYGFYLYDHDTTSPNDAMGTVPFQVPDGYPDSKTFKSSNDEDTYKSLFYLQLFKTII